jgi:hypothetical protein
MRERAAFLEPLREPLGDETYDRVWATGFAMPTGDAVAFALTAGERSDDVATGQLS